jgi:hypothetical protein
MRGSVKVYDCVIDNVNSVSSTKKATEKATEKEVLLTVIIVPDRIRRPKLLHGGWRLIV